MLSVQSLAENRMGVSSLTLLVLDLRTATGGMPSSVRAMKEPPIITRIPMTIIQGSFGRSVALM
jgi:hypothetical protein